MKKYKRLFKEAKYNDGIEDNISNMDIEEYIDDYVGKGSREEVTGYVISRNKIDKVVQQLEDAGVSFEQDSYGRDYILY